VTNLRTDGTLWQWRTWKSAAHHLFGAQGLVRQTFGAWRDYFRPDFHPGQHDGAASGQWLADNQARYQPVRG
jgi:predicted metal-dependent hydrolase